MSIKFTLDKVMEQKGLTQKDVIEKTGLNRNTVKTLAAGLIRRVDFDSLDKLCKGLNVSPTDLIEYIEDEKKKPQYIPLFPELEDD